MRSLSVSTNGPQCGGWSLPLVPECAAPAAKHVSDPTSEVLSVAPCPETPRRPPRESDIPHHEHFYLLGHPIGIEALAGDQPQVVLSWQRSPGRPQYSPQDWRYG